jgi:hypothetical protein
VLATKVAAGGQLPDTYFDERSQPAIDYAARPPDDPIARLNQKLQTGQVALTFEPGAGYLRSVLSALNVPVESQLAVFSKTSVQAALINPANPRSIFFSDEAVVAWPRGGFIEAAAIDPQLGVMFYVLNQQSGPAPQFVRSERCTTCHQSGETLGVPGMLLRSAPTRVDGRAMPQRGNYFTDHRSPLGERWGGWYVTGHATGGTHLGNALVTEEDQPESGVMSQTPVLTTLKDRFDTSGYLSPYSDIAALMVFDHQMQMSTLLTRISWEARAAGPSDVDALIRAAAREVVDYMLFIDEAPLPGQIEGSSGFTEGFSARGPRDERGRSLTQLDLTRRLLRYPCSYMIYTDAFDALPGVARDAIYRRMWEILSGRETGTRYVRLTPDDRQAIVEILRATKKGLPEYFLSPP